MQKSCSYYRGIFYCPVATTGEYLRENHQFRVWELRKSNFLYFPFDRASWDKYMFNGNISMKFYDMSHFARSNGKETVQTAHCAMWTSWCFLRFPARPNDLLHCAHLCSLIPLCIIKCFFRTPASLNDLLHCAHLCDFSPVWVNMWRLRTLAWPNTLPQCAHLCIFSPVWANMWAFKVWARPNSLLQSPHFPFLFHCGSACASSDFQPHRMICCIQHKCATCLQCVFSDVSSNVQLDWMICHIVHIWVRFPRTGILTKMCCFFEKSRALVWLNLKKKNYFCNCYGPIVSLRP